MQKAFLNNLLKKPSPYLNVWVYLYANSDDNGEFRIPSPYLLSMFKISRSTLQRILDYGCNWGASGKEVAREWQGNTLKVKWLNKVAEKEVAREWQENVQESEPEIKVKVTTKRKPKTESDKLFPKMIEEYNQFCISRMGAGAKMNALQGKAMKGIIEYLANQVKAKNGDNLTQEALEDNIFVAWQYILKNWDNVKGYYAEQIKLNQIDSNLPNILMQLKNNQKNKRDDKFANTHDEIGTISFE